MARVVPSVAYHEAGHAAIAIHFGIALKQVSIISGDDYAGFCSPVPLPSLSKLEYADSDRITKRTEKVLMTLLAGAEAQRKFAPKTVRRHQAKHDRETAFELVCRLVGSTEEASAYVNWLSIKTRNLLELPFIWAGVKGIAEALLKQRELSGKEAKSIYTAAFARATY